MKHHPDVPMNEFDRKRDESIAGVGTVTDADVAELIRRLDALRASRTSTGVPSGAESTARMQLGYVKERRAAAERLAADDAKRSAYYTRPTTPPPGGLGG